MDVLEVRHPREAGSAERRSTDIYLSDNPPVIFFFAAGQCGLAKNEMR